MRFLVHLPAILLGVLFLVFGINYFYPFFPVPKPPQGSDAAAFLGAMVRSDYFAFVKGLEIAGGALVLLPWTRRYGLLVLLPIIVNIAAYQFFFFGERALVQPPVLAVLILGVLALWFERWPFLRFMS